MYKFVENASINFEEFDSQTTSIIINKWVGQHALGAEHVESDKSQLLLCWIWFIFQKKKKKRSRKKQKQQKDILCESSLTDKNIRAQRINKFKQT